MSKNKNEIQVSICLVTYNQEKYIAECLESLIAQDTELNYEIIVGEDCSTDSTRAIVQRYVSKYPDLIIPIFYEQNVGPVENIKQVYKRARGKYIAHMDGDDLALPKKLQKQFETLEANPDCAICVHNMKAIDANGESIKLAYPVFQEEKYTLLDLYLINPFFVHSSKMFINKIEEYIDDLDDSALDLEAHIEQAKQGHIYFLVEDLGVYRQFVGVTYQDSFVSPMVRQRIQTIFDTVDESLFSAAQLDEIRAKYARILFEYAYQCAVTVKDKKLFKEYVRKSLMVKDLGITSRIFKLSLLSPSLFFKLSEVRKNIRLKRDHA